MKIIDIIQKSDDCFAGTGATNEVINDAEKVLNVVFNTEYRAYLAKYGVVAVNGHELTGICSSKRLNVVNVTRVEREDKDVPVGWYVVEQLNIDGIVVWQAEDGVIYQTAPSSKAMKLCDSLAEYIVM